MPIAALKSCFTDDQRSNITNRRRAVGVHHTNSIHDLYTGTAPIQSPFKNPPYLIHSKIQEAKLVKRPSDLRRGLQRREEGVVHAFPHPFISDFELFACGRLKDDWE